ncbi:ABC transporter substrate-binding protein [Candidatus Bipolaricaulota bacterium]|nr:ABC transporter substrate-binding protein [Candidatus Bipolaricaulota bacterium]
MAVQPIVHTDPALISSDAEVAVANAVYDYLVDVDAGSRIEPRLATDWDISADGLMYTFYLADGVFFHDGTPLHADDVVWTFERLRDPVIGSSTADLYGNILSVEATGDRIVQFALMEPNPFFLYDLSDNHALIVQAETTDFTAFNGTGPFMLETYYPEDRLILRANPDYFVEGLPMLDRVEFIFFPDEVAAVGALRGDQVDLAWRMSAPLFLSLSNEPGITLMEVPTNGFDVVRLRSDRAPGDDPRVMEALKLATDRDEILALVQLGRGVAGRDTPIGPLYAEYYDDSISVPERDVARARDLLRQAGYVNGIRLELHTPDTGGRPDLAVVLKEQWADAGIDVDVIVEPESVYYGADGWLEVDLGITGWGSRPYPQFYLDQMLACGAPWNESHFCDAEFDRLASIAGSTRDEEERVSAYAQIQQLMSERGPLIIPYFFAALAAIDQRFDGFELKAFPGRSDLRTILSN